MKLITERTEALLKAANLGPVKSLYVPDNHPIYDQEQLDLFEIYKTAFGCQAAQSTFKIAHNKDDERVVYEPSVVARDGVLLLDWGGEVYPLPVDCFFKAGRCTLAVDVGDQTLELKVRVYPIKKEELSSDATATQKQWASASKDDKIDMLSRIWAKGTIHEIVASGAETVCKLADCLGTWQVVGFKMGAFDKYVLKLADGRWVRANTALQNKLADYEEAGVEVSPEQPATLTVADSEKLTSQGHKIYKTTLLSAKNAEIPVFDFAPVVDKPLEKLTIPLTT